MHIIVVTVVLSIVGLIMSLAFVGIVPSFVALILSIYCLVQKKSIARARALALSVVGVILPIIMYINSYGISAPHLRADGLSFVAGIIYDNYSNMGLNMEWMKDNKLAAESMGADLAAGEGENGDGLSGPGDGAGANDGGSGAFDDAGAAGGTNGAFGAGADDGPGAGGAATDSEDAMYYVSNEGKENKPEEPVEPNSIDASQYNQDIFEKLEEATNDYDKKPISTKVGASDDDMPSYGGLPVGTLIVAQYFREDVHNCNPVLVLQNKTGKTCRYEGRFIARDEDGNELDTSEVCVEVVENDAKFVLEGRFDKSELGGKIPAMYEFSVTKRDPYEMDMTGDVVVYTKEKGNSVVVAAENLSDKRVKVDAFVLFFDNNELVDCIWLIPHNQDDVCVTPGSVASIRGDAYYRFDRTETYYTAYEAVGGIQD